MDWSIVSAVNNERVLRESLLRSPDLHAGIKVLIEKDHSSAAAAYNTALEKVDTDLVMFVHQDVYLPPGWFAKAEKALKQVEECDPNWGVIGVWGPTRPDNCTGYLYWTGVDKPRGDIFEGGVEVETLDEVVLIIRKSSGLRFDSKLPGFHMYGPDICLQSRSMGRKCYAISVLCVHNTNTYKLLPLQFWHCYWYMRRKWRRQLPVSTSCTVITRGCWPAIWWNILRLKNLLLGRHETFRRVANPNEVYNRLVL